MMETMTRVEKHGGNPYIWHRGRSSACHAPGKVCRFWLTGNCTKNPCRFLHPDRVSPMSCVMPLKSLKSKQSRDLTRPSTVLCKKVKEGQCFPKRKQITSAENVVKRRAPSQHMKEVRRRMLCVKPDDVSKMSIEPNDGSVEIPSVELNDGVAQKPSIKFSNGGCRQKVQLKICERWIKNSCTYGEKCKYVHSWSSGDGFSKLAQLEGHKKAITGINLPLDFDKLFSASEDGTVRVWNCNTGECTAVVDLGAPVGCLISQGPWVFAGITNAIKAWNLKTEAELILDVPGGRVYALAVTDRVLFAGLQDGSIYVLKFNSDATGLEATSILRGHSGAVITLVYGGNRLYSGAMDNKIRVWDLESMLCIQTLKQHSEVVMSMVCWGQFLISCSLDNTLQIWAATETGELEVTYTQKEEHGILSLCGLNDTSGKPILLCSCNDNTVHLYELPSFIERGRIFAKEEVRTIHLGPGGLFFTGDGSGLVSVWKCSGELTASLESC